MTCMYIAYSTVIPIVVNSIGKDLVNTVILVAYRSREMLTSCVLESELCLQSRIWLQNDLVCMAHVQYYQSEQLPL